MKRNSRRITINGFNNFVDETGEIPAKSFYNYYPKRRLENSYGIATATFPFSTADLSEQYELDITPMGDSKIVGVTFVKQYFKNQKLFQYRMLLYGEDKRIYIYQMVDRDMLVYAMYGMEFNNMPIVLSFREDDQDTILLASNDKMVAWEAGYSPYEIEGVPIITSMCYGDDKILYCTIVEPAFKIWYCYDITPETIGNVSATSNYLSLDDDLGNAIKVVNFDENIYVFRDLGITKITHINNKFTNTPVYSSNTQIFCNTISQCGNEILFMTRDGLYSFNGIKVNKCNIDLSNMLTNLGDNEVASSLGDKYYLAMHLDFQDDKKILCETGEYTNNAVLIVDIRDYSYQILRGVDVKTLYALKTDICEKMLLTFNSNYENKLGEIVEIGKCFDTNLPKYWRSGLLTDGINPKLFTKLSVMADKGVKFNLILDDRSESFTTYNEGYNEFFFKVQSRYVALEISSGEDSARVEEINLDYYEY